MTISFLSARTSQWPGPRTREVFPLSGPSNDSRLMLSPENFRHVLRKFAGNWTYCLYHCNTEESLLILCCRQVLIQFCPVTWEQERLWPRSRVNDNFTAKVKVSILLWSSVLTPDNLCDVWSKPGRYRERERDWCLQLLPQTRPVSSTEQCSVWFGHSYSGSPPKGDSKNIMEMYLVLAPWIMCMKNKSLTSIMSSSFN